MPTVYPVANAPRRLGQGAMGDDDIAALEEYAELVLDDIFFSMSADSQMAFQDKKNACLALLDQARVSREVETYLEANTCLDEARHLFSTVAANEQWAVEERTDPLPASEAPGGVTVKRPAEEPRKEEEGIGTLGWLLIGGAGILVLAGIASAAP